MRQRTHMIDEALGAPTYYKAVCGETTPRNLMSRNTVWSLVTCLDCLKHEPKEQP